MTLRLEIDGIDRTAFWRLYESRWTSKAWNGESVPSEFVLDDDGTISHATLAARKIVTVWEDASGTDVCMYRGRISNKHLGQGPSQVHNDMRWIVETEDYNIDLRGIRVNNAVRPIETDEVRFEAIRVAFLNGAASTHPVARDSTDLGNTFLGEGVAVNLEAETYTDTDPLGVFTRIVEVSGRTFFVITNDDGTGDLYYGDHTDESYDSDIEITDAGFADSADGIDVYAAYKGPNAGEHAGQNVLTGAALRWGDGNLYEDSDVGGAEAVYDKWEETFTNEWVQHTTQADNIVNKLVGLADEDFTYLATIDMRAEHAHRIRAGMMVLLKRYRANKPTQGYVRAVQVQHIPRVSDEDGNTYYQVQMDLGRAQGRRLIPRGRHKPGPYPTQPTVPGGDVDTGRLYYTEPDDVTSGLTNANYSASWTAADSSVSGPRRLRATPQTTLFNAASGSTYAAVNVAVATIVSELWSCRLDETGGLLAAVQDGATWRTVIRSNNRHGLGIDEGAQQNFPDWTIRIFRPGTGFIDTVFDVGDATAAYRFDPGPAFPSIPMSATGAAVPGAVATDYLVVDLGGAHDAPITGGTGWAYRQADSSATDLPFAVDSVADQNAWLEFSTSGGGGGTAGDGAEELIGTCEAYQRCDDTEHLHSAVLPGGSREPTVNDDVDAGMRVGTQWLDETTGRTWWLTDNTVGAAVWVLTSDPTPAGAGSTLTIEEDDGAPTGIFDTLKVPNATLTDNGDGSASLGVAAAVHTHGTIGSDFAGVLVRRTTDFTTSNSNDSVPDFDTQVYDTDAAWAIGNPDELVIPAAWDGLMVQVYGMALWATGTDNYTEMKVYRNVTRPVDASADEGNLVAVTQHVPATSYNTGQLALSPPIQVATGDTFLMALRNPAAETVEEYHNISIQFGAWVVGSGGASALDDLTDVTITTPALGDMLRYNGTAWVNTPGRWEPVTTNPGGGPELVWDGDDLLMAWVNT